MITCTPDIVTVSVAKHREEMAVLSIKIGLLPRLASGDAGAGEDISAKSSGESK